MPRSIFLIPGVGAQGGKPELLGAAFSAGRAAGAGRRLARDRRRPRSGRRRGAPAGDGLGDLDRLTTPAAAIRSARSRSDSPASPMEKRTSATARIFAAMPWRARSSSWSWSSRRARRQLGSSTSTTRRVTHAQKEAGKKPRTKAKTYMVKSGDTLTSIAHETGVPVAEILALNPEVDPQILIAGETLKLDDEAPPPRRRAAVAALACLLLPAFVRSRRRPAARGKGAPQARARNRSPRLGPDRRPHRRSPRSPTPAAGRCRSPARPS